MADRQMADRPKPHAMADLGIFAALVGLFAVVGIGLGILAARRLGAWDERRATAEAGAVQTAGGAGSTAGKEPLEDGGDTVD
jgi:hypothetical protein